MDERSLIEVLEDSEEPQYWLKPVGDPGKSVNLSREYTEREIKIEFAKHPGAILVGDVLVVYRIGISKLVYVAKCLTPSQFDPSEERWPWAITAENLTPEYGAIWSTLSLKPFALATEFNDRNPGNQAQINGIKFGSDKIRIPRDFAHFMIRRILESPQRSINIGAF